MFSLYLNKREHKIQKSEMFITKKVVFLSLVMQIVDFQKENVKQKQIC